MCEYNIGHDIRHLENRSDKKTRNEYHWCTLWLVIIILLILFLHHSIDCAIIFTFLARTKIHSMSEVVFLKIVVM